MNTPDTGFGWLFVAMAAIFALGLIPRWAVRYYPTSPPFLVRLAAPVIFAVLASACFLGLAVKAFAVLIVCGMILILIRRTGLLRRR
jgi:hypothetical protein